jgi:hypothetical protein
MKRRLAFALALSVCGLSLSCLTICAAHAEQSSCAPDEISVALTEHDDECCSLDALRSLPPDRVRKTPVGLIARPILPTAIFDFHDHCRTPNPIDEAPPPAISPPLQRIPALRI